MSTPCAVPWFAALVCAALAGCNLDNPGVQPPSRRINFPLALATSASPAPDEAARWLYVVNSNFNLRYNQGSLHSLDLQIVDDALRRERCVEATAMECRQAGGEFEAGRCCLSCLEAPEIMCDGRDVAPLQACCHDDLGDPDFPFIPEGGEVFIPSFGSSVELSSSGSRLYVSVRAEGALLSIDVDEAGRLRCGQDRESRCADAAQVGQEKPLPDTDAQFGALPLDLVAGSAQDFGVGGDGEMVLVGHDDASVSLFRDRGDGPQLLATLPPVLPTRRLVTLRRRPSGGEVFITHELSSEVSRVGLTEQGGEVVPFISSPLLLTGLQNSDNVREVAFDSRNPERLFALVRGNSTTSTAIVQSLYFLQLDSDSTREVRSLGAERVGLGPARLKFAVIDGAPFVFVSCYDDRTLFIFRADTRQLAAFVRGMFGPFEFEVDPVRQRLYVGDFASSTVRVVDLRGLVDSTRRPPRVVLILGEPSLAGGGF